MGHHHCLAMAQGRHSHCRILRCGARKQRAAAAKHRLALLAMPKWRMHRLQLMHLPPILASASRLSQPAAGS